MHVVGLSNGLCTEGILLDVYWVADVEGGGASC